MSGNCKIPSGETKIDWSQIGTERVPRGTDEHSDVLTGQF